VLAPLIRAGGVFCYSEDEPVENLLTWLAATVPVDVRVSPKTPALRVRHVVKEGQHYYLIFNEEQASLDFILELATEGSWLLFDAVSGNAEPFLAGRSIHLDGYELKILIAPAS
jgi:hypothetical protein